MKLLNADLDMITVLNIDEQDILSYHILYLSKLKGRKNIHLLKLQIIICDRKYINGVIFCLRIHSFIKWKWSVGVASRNELLEERQTRLSYNTELQSIRWPNEPLYPVITLLILIDYNNLMMILMNGTRMFCFSEVSEKNIMH